jgi:hypothetical protein
VVPDFLPVGDPFESPELSTQRRLVIFRADLVIPSSDIERKENEDGTGSKRDGEFCRCNDFFQLFFNNEFDHAWSPAAVLISWWTRIRRRPVN